jgi:hypothetical protein
MALAHGLRGIDGLLLQGLSAGQRLYGHGSWHCTSGFFDRVPCQRLKCPLGPFAGGWRVGWGRLGLVTYGGRNWSIWRPAGRQMLQQCFSLLHQPQLRHSAEEAPCLQELFHLGWRDFLRIKNPAFWCISMRAPLAFIGSSNAGHHLPAKSGGLRVSVGSQK